MQRKELLLIHLIIINSIFLVPWKSFISLWGLMLYWAVSSVLRLPETNTAGLMFNATQHPNETGHWFAFRDSHLERHGWEGGEIIAIQSRDLCRALDNSDSLDRDRPWQQPERTSHDLCSCHSIMNPSHRRHHFGVVLDPGQQHQESFCCHKYPGTVNNNGAVDTSESSGGSTDS